ncbi:uncharacterized protein B0T23DRAFT_406272 [Neurospora hispaniola]|uniref:Uncharacterized protein n=1 Tax=Neurospora hispaniola TaxID=588809 RepID=A0AAJ0I3Q1_9PEZI|nr:hypothetical protein B0T23DRAFT_406272 [Neurospora hispaniola]
MQGSGTWKNHGHDPEEEYVIAGYADTMFFGYYLSSGCTGVRTGLCILAKSEMRTSITSSNPRHDVLGVPRGFVRRIVNGLRNGILSKVAKRDGVEASQRTCVGLVVTTGQWCHFKMRIM